MKIVIFDDLPEGGAKRVVFEQIKRLNRHHTLTYITNTMKTRFPFERHVDHIHRFDLDLLEENSWKRPIKEMSYYFKIVPALRKIACLINEIDPNVVILHPSRLSQAPTLIQYVKQPTLYFAEEWLRTVYEPEIHPLPESKLKAYYEMKRRKWIARLDLDSVRGATRVVCTSRYTQRTLLSAYDNLADVIPLGVDEKMFQPGNSTDPGKYFLFIGEKEEINGYPLLSEAVRINSALTPVKCVGFKNRLTFAYSDAQLVKMYQRAVAVLCLAKNEPFGLVALESMACAIPVIAVNEAGYQETVVHKRTGLLVDRNPLQLADAMYLLQSDAQLRRRLGENGRKRIERLYSWNKHVNQLEKILRSIKS